MDEKRLLEWFAVLPLRTILRGVPLVVAICRQNTSSLRESPSIGGFFSHRLHPSINHLVANCGVLRPTRHQAPLHNRQLTTHLWARLRTAFIRPAFIRPAFTLVETWSTVHDGVYKLRWRHVVVRLEHLVWGGDHLKLLDKVGRIFTRRIPSAHALILPHDGCERRARYELGAGNRVCLH